MKRYISIQLTPFWPENWHTHASASTLIIIMIIIITSFGQCNVIPHQAMLFGEKKILLLITGIDPSEREIDLCYLCVPNVLIGWLDFIAGGFKLVLENFLLS